MILYNQIYISVRYIFIRFSLRSCLVRYGLKIDFNDQNKINVRCIQANVWATHFAHMTFQQI